MENSNTTIEILGIIAATLVGLVSLFLSIRNTKKLGSAQTEIQIAQYIYQTKKDIVDIAIKTGKNEIIESALSAAIEINLNAYEEACAKYIDKKIDRKRFKKNYCVEIRRLVESKDYKKYFDPNTSSYKAILKVYKEWNDLEK